MLTRFLPDLRIRALSLQWLLVFALLGGTAFASGSLPPDQHAKVSDRVLLNAGHADEAFDSFIVYYHDDAALDDEKSASAKRTRRRLDAELVRVSESLGYNVRHERRLATGGHLIRLQSGKTLSQDSAGQFMAAMAADPQIQAIEPNARAYIQMRPTDPFYSIQWGLSNVIGGINVESAWDRANGNGVVIAIVDTGSTPHPDLDAQLVSGYDFISDPEAARDGDGRDDDPTDEGDWFERGDCPNRADSRRNSSWHGTHVAGIAAAETNNGIGVAGVAFGAKLQHVRALGRCGGTLADISDAIVWASGGRVSGVPANATPARVINLSLGGEGVCGPTYERAIDQAQSKGSVVIVAAGNDNAPAQETRPANCPGVVTVAAGNRDGERAFYSNHGNKVDVTAPGGHMTAESGEGGIASAYNDGDKEQGEPIYVYSQGTSMATPFVAGVAALMLSKNSALTPKQVRKMLIDTARPFPGICADGCGTGIVDANAAVNAAEGKAITHFPVSIAHGDIGAGTITSTPTGIDCGATCSARFARGTTITLQAKAAEGSRFSGWSGACSGRSSQCTLSADRAHAAIAEFSVPHTRLSGPGVLEGLSSDASPLMYSFTVPTGVTALRFSIRDGTGDADLYARHGEKPTFNEYDCRPYRDGNSETCNFPAPMSGTYFVMIAGDPKFADVRFEARYTSGPAGGRTLRNGVPIENQSAQTDGARYFRIFVPTSASRLRIETQGNNGDLDLYVSTGAVPKLDSFQWVSGEYGSNEAIVIDNPASGTYYIMAHAYTAYSGVSVTARYTNVTLDWTGLGAGSVEIKRAINSDRAPPCTAFPCEASLKNASHDLIATPSIGSRFGGWDASECDAIVNGNCRVRPTRHRDVKVQFTRDTTSSPTLTVKTTGNGRGSVAIRDVISGKIHGVCENFTCRSGPPEGSYELIAIPLPGSRFTGWDTSQCEQVVAGNCRVKINQPIETTATFQALR